MMFEYVYELTHSYVVDEAKEINETKLIGFLSSYEKARDTIQQYQKLIGFRDYPDGFHIRKVQIDFDDYEFV